ncbi:MAG: nucleotidyltransferase [Mesoaciditoga sp.]|uniref:nucleotidyltransferase n=1 Tax=Athalassotoga sp. TaxID=2022597 RepID=UPI000CC804C2|nr:MAG: nucleotidyltransferase [Mesoaciditoga sp.]PMP80423.1 MAG: nucleotidyltransferase [Mesoaciditoga sp.]HEU25137.1 nucleotidyltransferase [Mesoaciditoga lauensis]
MKVLGIIVEYNPFHNGHLYHLKNAISLVKPDFVVAVMSGNFVQRGEPAIIDKFARAEMALRAGVDAIFEIPSIYAFQDASGFATGAVGLLNSMNVVDDLVFGSESNDIESISEIASVIVEEPEEFKKRLKEHLKKGLSFPNARRFAISGMLEEKSDNMRYSNNILGIEYIVALQKLRSRIKPHTIKRIGSDYNDERMSEIPSATAIRKAIFQGSGIRGLPDFSFEILRREFEEGRGPVFPEDLFDFLRKKVLILEREGLEGIYGFNEGIAERFFISACKSANLKEFLESVKTKRFTFTRIKRRMIYAIFDVDRELVLRSNDHGPQYLRLLGFRHGSREVLRAISDRSSIPVISNMSGFKNALKSKGIDVALAQDQMKYDLKVSNFYRLYFKSQNCEDDFRKPVVI